MPRNTAFPTFEEAFAWLAARTNYETMATQRYDARTYGLSRVERLLDAVGRPDRAFDAVQVLGSKGKGSTAAALAEILRASGRRVGLLTSPHLVDPRERIRVDGRPARDRLVCDALASLVPLVEAAAARGEPLTFFEIHTVAALCAFRAARCDAAVLEAGMGGRLDATTAATSKCKVLTSISLDHTQHLGRTRAAIAREKAAASRRGVPLVCGEPLSSAAGRVVARIGAKSGATLLALGRDFRVRRARTSFDAANGRSKTTFSLEFRKPAPRHGQWANLRKRPGHDAFGVPASAGRRETVPRTVSYSPAPWLARTRRGDPQGPADAGTPNEAGPNHLDLEVPLLGLHQARNAALAAVAALTTRWRGTPVTAEHVRRGLARTAIRARLETIARAPLVVVDGAHNPASFGVLAKTVRGHVPGRPRVFVVGMSADKDVRGCLRRLRGVADLVVTTTSGQARAASPSDLAAAARAVGLRAAPQPDVRAALAAARRRAGRGGLVVVTGSLYLCGACLAL